MLFSLIFSMLAPGDDWLNFSRAPVPVVEPVAIIDAHTHTDFSEGHTAEMFLAELGRAGAIGAVSHTSSKDFGTGYADLTANGVIHCAGISTDATPELVEKGLREGRYRCVKIYLGYVPRWATDPVYEPYYHLAEQYDVPVVFHTGDTNDKTARLKYADPLTIDDVAVDHPRVRFVIAHCGNPWIQSAAEVAYKNDNVFLDGSAFLIGNIAATSPEVVDKYMVEPIRWIMGYTENSRKLMFGSDWPLVSIADYAAVFRRAIDPRHWQSVFHDNAARVFKDFACGPGSRMARTRACAPAQSH